MAPVAGILADRFGGRWVMTLGSVVAGLALMGMSLVEGRISLFALVLIAEAAGMCVLYQTAFASVVRLESRVKPVRAISVITLFGGVASTVFWPLTLWLYEAPGWQNTWVVPGAMMLAICVPIHFFVLGGPHRDHAETGSTPG